VVAVTGRCKALTMPVVTVSDRPSGLPMAITGSSTLAAPDAPNVARVSPLGGAGAERDDAGPVRTAWLARA
jgi:hypothetical protein